MTQPLVADLFAIAGITCLACAIGFVIWIHLDIRAQDRRAALTEREAAANGRPHSSAVSHIHERRRT
jgi:hypothetical protein